MGRGRRITAHRQQRRLAHRGYIAGGRYRAMRVVTVDHGSIEAGFALPDLRLRVLGDREIFGAPPKRVKLRAVKEGVPVTLADLRVGDYVVHAVHGIGQYLGLRTETILGATQDYLDLAYAGSDRMLVPVHADASGHEVLRDRRAAATPFQDGRRGLGAHQVPRLRVAGEDRRRSRAAVRRARAQPRLSRSVPTRRGRPRWKRRSRTSRRPIKARRSTRSRATWKSAQPMDRLVCGDVGYGKTEVAMRAAFKAVAEKKQVAVLVPTTLLADQHYRNFSARFAGFPMRIEELSRFKTKARSARDSRGSRTRQSRRGHRHASSSAKRRRLRRSRA